MIIYGVYKYGGEYEDYYNKLIKCFVSLDKAEEYVAKLTASENIKRSQSKRCANCSGYDKTCPLWIESYNAEDGCENWYMSYLDNEYYEIKDIELEE